MKKTLFLVSLLMILTACFGGYSEDSRFYSLQPFEDVQPVSQKKLIIGIDRVTLPEYVDRPQIVSSKKDSTQIEISETNRWSESLDSLIQRTLTSDLSAYLPQAVVKEKTLNDRFNYVIELQITRFDMIKDDQAVLETWWYLTNTRDNTVYRQKFLQTTSIGGSFDDFVKAESNLLASLAKDIAEKISN